MAILLLAFAGGGTVSADTSIVEWGPRGPHRLAETAASGTAANCLYGGAENRLLNVRVKPPLIRSSDHHPGAGNDPQWVGWRARFQSWDGAGWKTIKVTKTEYVIANDDAWATFPSSFHRWTADGPGYVIRALVDMAWQRPTNSEIQVGGSRHRVDFYRASSDSVPSTRETGYCDSQVGGP